MEASCRTDRRIARKVRLNAASCNQEGSPGAMRRGWSICGAKQFERVDQQAPAEGVLIDPSVEYVLRGES